MKCLLAADHDAIDLGPHRYFSPGQLSRHLAYATNLQSLLISVILSLGQSSCLRRSTATRHSVVVDAGILDLRLEQDCQTPAAPSRKHGRFGDADIIPSGDQSLYAYTFPSLAIPPAWCRSGFNGWMSGKPTLNIHYVQRFVSSKHWYSGASTLLQRLC